MVDTAAFVGSGYRMNCFLDIGRGVFVRIVEERIPMKKLLSGLVLFVLLGWRVTHKQRYWVTERGRE